MGKIREQLVSIVGSFRNSTLRELCFVTKFLEIPIQYHQKNSSGNALVLYNHCPSLFTHL